MDDRKWLWSSTGGGERNQTTSSVTWILLADTLLHAVEPLPPLAFFCATGLRISLPVTAPPSRRWDGSLCPRCRNCLWTLVTRVTRFPEVTVESVAAPPTETRPCNRVCNPPGPRESPWSARHSAGADDATRSNAVKHQVEPSG